MTTPSFNERRAGIQLRKAVRLSRGPRPNWCQVNDASVIVRRHYHYVFWLNCRIALFAV